MKVSTQCDATVEIKPNSMLEITLKVIENKMGNIIMPQNRSPDAS